MPGVQGGYGKGQSGAGEANHEAWEAAALEGEEGEVLSSVLDLNFEDNGTFR